MVEGIGLENRQELNGSRGFKSLLLRQMKHTDIEVGVLFAFKIFSEKDFYYLKKTEN